MKDLLDLADLVLGREQNWLVVEKKRFHEKCEEADKTTL
jgi:hypothetical protein